MPQLAPNLALLFLSLALTHATNLPFLRHTTNPRQRVLAELKHTQQQTKDNNNNDENKIIAGVVVGDGEADFVVPLVYCLDGSTFSRSNHACTQFCSGSLVAPNVVLTAAHCVWDNVQDDYLFNTTFIYVASARNWMAEEFPGSSFHRVTAVEVTSEYQKNYNEIMGDVALVQIADCLDKDLAQLATPNQTATDGDTVVGYGYGKTDLRSSSLFPENDRASLSRTEELTVRSSTDCTNHYYYVIQFLYFTTENGRFTLSTLARDLDFGSMDRIMCQGPANANNYRETTGSTICSGDSGGPMILQDGDNSLVVGVNSFGVLSCGTSPLNYAARVSFYASWIYDKLSDLDNTAHCSGFDFDAPEADELVPQTVLDPYGGCDLSENSSFTYCGTCVASGEECDGTDDCSSKQDELFGQCTLGHISQTCDLLDTSVQNQMVSCASPLEGVISDIGTTDAEVMDSCGSFYVCNRNVGFVSATSGHSTCLARDSSRTIGSSSRLASTYVSYEGVCEQYLLQEKSLRDSWNTRILDCLVGQDSDCIRSTDVTLVSELPVSSSFAVASLLPVLCLLLLLLLVVVV